MTTSETQDPDTREAGTGTLIVEAAREFQTLLEQEWEMAKVEVKSEYRHARQAAELSAVGLAVGLIAGVFLCLGLAHGLHAAGLVLWGAYLIVGAVAAVATLVLFQVAAGKTKNVNMVPDRTVKALKEET